MKVCDKCEYNGLKQYEYPCNECMFSNNLKDHFKEYKDENQ